MGSVLRWKEDHGLKSATLKAMLAQWKSLLVEVAWKSTDEKDVKIITPNLLGIERRIAYANKKYHSGWVLPKKCVPRVLEEVHG